MYDQFTIPDMKHINWTTSFTLVKT